MIEETPAKKGGTKLRLLAHVRTESCGRVPDLHDSSGSLHAPYTDMQRLSHQGSDFSPGVHLYGMF